MGQRWLPVSSKPKQGQTTRLPQILVGVVPFLLWRPILYVNYPIELATISASGDKVFLGDHRVRTIY